MWQSGAANNSMAASDSGFFRTGATPTQDERPQSRFRIQTLVPMTIGQIYKCMSNTENLSIGDLDVSMVSIVGLVLSVEQQTTGIRYEIDDMTGPVMKVQHWVTDNEEEDAFGAIKKPMVENTYVRVVGSVKKMDGKLHVVVFNISPITDLNKLTTHLLEVINSKNAAEVTLKQLQNKFDDVSFTSDDTKEIPMDYDTSNAPDGLNKQQLAVYRTIQNATGPSGCSLEDIVENVKSCAPSTIKQILSVLCDEGHVYSTIDDCHFKTTDGI